MRRYFFAASGIARLASLIGYWFQDMKRSTFAAGTTVIAGMLATKAFAADVSGSHDAPYGVQRIAMVVYPGMTALDLIAPQLIFTAIGNTDVQLVWKDRKTITSDSGVPIVPTQAFDDVANGLTALFVPGGTRSYSMMNDAHVVNASLTSG